MCGILGYFGGHSHDFKNKTSLDLINHRGPDFKDEIIGETFYLGHTRLSILDLSNNGNQPMISKDGNFVIIFNGEIYNHLDLREKYLNDIDFISTCDTETLLYGLIKKGTEFINKLNGIFSFSFYNIKTKEFIIVRDHFGVKPLYYCYNKNDFFFSSTIKAHQLPSISCAIFSGPLFKYSLAKSSASIYFSLIKGDPSKKVCIPFFLSLKYCFLLSSFKTIDIKAWPSNRLLRIVNVF